MRLRKGAAYRLHLAGGAGFEPATPGSGGLCPILARHREKLPFLYPPKPARHFSKQGARTHSFSRLQLQADSSMKDT